MHLYDPNIGKSSCANAEVFPQVHTSHYISERNGIFGCFQNPAINLCKGEQVKS